MAGEKFGKLTVLSYADGGKWMCQCECRNKPAHAIMTTNLTSGNTTSCGCARVKHRLSNTAEYKREKTKRWYRNNPDRAAESAKKWRKKNSEKVKRLRKGWIANNRVKQMLLQARKRAKERGIPFLLMEADISIPEKCSVLGIPLAFGGKECRDNWPTLDRIDNDHGYVPGNVRVISYRANRLKSDANDNEMVALGKDAQTRDGHGAVT